MQKRAGRVAQVVECLPSKHEDLTLNSSTAKKKKRKEKEKMQKSHLIKLNIPSL
jgi:hypothetical protein